VRNDLARHDWKLEAVARQWGFYDASHLLKLYRRHYGRTPAQDRIKLSRSA